ncbi:hypothetical protein EDC04DRAFT_2911953 [Pisolithus marmoratus]|nr:hypothetical protein EDC04DRAFT_2911953 [Pisolithus marmoratus]
MSKTQPAPALVHQGTPESSSTTTLDTIVPIRNVEYKKESLLGFVDYPLLDEQTSKANSRLLHEAVRVQQEEIDRLKPQKKITLLLDGWEDCLKRSLYGSVAVEVNHYPVVLALEDMTGLRGTAENLVAISQKAMNGMEIGDGKNVIAITTDNPTVMQAYHRKMQGAFPWILAPFAGGQADGLAWWEHSPVSADAHPLKALAVTILSIVPHAGDVEQLFSDLGSTQSPRRCNLSVDTFQTLGKIHANLCYHLDVKNTAAGKQTHQKHAHMHARDEPGINMDVASDLEKNFSWVPPLSAHSDDELAGPESISLDEIDAEFAALEALQKEVEQLDQSTGSQEVLYDFEELR